MTSASPHAFTNTSTSATTPSLRPHPSPTYSSSSGTHHTDDTASGSQGAGRGSSTQAKDILLNEDPVAKRQRNTVAARRYRQRKVDRMADLERQLAEMRADRDDLKDKLARREAEVGALREVLAARK